MKSFFFLLIGILLICGSFYAFWNQELPDSKRVGQLKIGEVTLNIEVVDTPEARAQGLSGREGLADNSGMLFVFDHSGLFGFWMKDMNFSLDMIWISESWRVVDIAKDVSPETYPQIFMPKEPAKYVLEVPAGFAEKNGIDIGTQVYFE